MRPLGCHPIILFSFDPCLVSMYAILSCSLRSIVHRTVSAVGSYLGPHENFGSRIIPAFVSHRDPPVVSTVLDEPSLTVGVGALRVDVPRR